MSDPEKIGHTYLQTKSEINKYKSHTQYKNKLK